MPFVGRDFLMIDQHLNDKFSFLTSRVFKLVILLLIPLSVVTYLYGLDSQYVLNNPDENPYMYIARLTAGTQHWLPLQSEVDHLKNTKPPLLFWQGIASTNFAQDWNLFNLRLPSFIYTFLTALFLFFSVKRFSKNTQTGLLAALVWLSFIGTYRFGRPYLTEPPEIFWLILPFFALLYWGKRAFESKWLFPLFAAISLGLALLYKSFFYVMPVGLALTLWYGCWRDWRLFFSFKHDAIKLILVGVVSLAIFSLWFIFDPVPEAVWREFVLGENLGKIEPKSGSYLQHLLWGGRSIWSVMFSTIASAGLLSFVLLTTLWQCWRKRETMLFEEKLLWLLILAFFLAFMLPSHRSGRYMLPVMPAYAALMALYWQRLPLWGFRIALILQFAILAALYWLSWNLQGSQWLINSVWQYPFWHWVILLMGLAVVLLGIIKTSPAKVSALAGCFLCYCALTSSLAPLDGSLGHYSAAAIQQVQNQDLWIPCSSQSKKEKDRLLLPGVRLHGYPAEDAKALAFLAERYPLYVAYVPQGVVPELCNGCQMIGGRVHMLTHQRSKEIKKILLGKIGTHLFINEYLITGPIWVNTPAFLYEDVC